jgi:hypothetical protein
MLDMGYTHPDKASAMFLWHDRCSNRVPRPGSLSQWMHQCHDSTSAAGLRRWVCASMRHAGWQSYRVDSKQSVPRHWQRRTPPMFESPCPRSLQIRARNFFDKLTRSRERHTWFWMRQDRLEHILQPDGHSPLDHTMLRMQGYLGNLRWACPI